MCREVVTFMVNDLEILNRGLETPGWLRGEKGRLRRCHWAKKYTHHNKGVVIVLEISSNPSVIWAA